MLKLAFTPRWLGALLFALALATGFMLLSKWQLGTADSGQIHANPAKEAVQPLHDVAHPSEPVLESQADSMVQVKGHYVEKTSRLIEGRVNDGTKGYWVVSQFAIDAEPQESGEQYSVPVARGFTTDSDPGKVGTEPTGEMTVVGRLVANEAPVTSQDTKTAGALGSAATAQLANLWDTPLYAGTLTAEAETPVGQPAQVDSDGHVKSDAQLADPHGSLTKIHSEQVVDHSVNWLNIFYAIEWVVFAVFAIYLWWRMLADSHERMIHPEKYYEILPAGEGNMFYEESTGRYFYYDAEAREYYYFDEPETGEKDGADVVAENSSGSTHDKQRGDHGGR
ncbi:SURF1 family protein [Rothia uropygialis]|uniref:SURF1 family protein n=1 Tax=Kocuria sp. 36 TaxID=1415402 RepID=UPI00101D898E|nr:SURF1 family cytochrome oxidase biogenesis protein [Kocuria sp. 36]